MIKDIVSNEEVKTFFRNELKSDKKSGTYLFYGSDTEQLMEFALYFTKGLCCETLEGDFCDTCNVCRKIDKLIYSDLEILDDPSGIKVDAVRELAYKSSSSSRSILVKIKKRNAEELDVDDFTYTFYMGNSEDIKGFKNSEINLNESEFYGNIGNFLKKYTETKELEHKTGIYKCIRDFIKGRYYISPQEKIFLVEEIMRGTSDKELYRKIIEYTIYVLGDMQGLEKRLTLKGMLRYPVNMKLVLLELFLKI